MDVISNLGLGFAVALTIQNIAYCFIGVLLGTIIGVLPGIGPVTTVAMCCRSRSPCSRSRP
jgi:TctA family transporter